MTLGGSSPGSTTPCGDPHHRGLLMMVSVDIRSCTRFGVGDINSNFFSIDTVSYSMSKYAWPFDTGEQLEEQ